MAKKPISRKVTANSTGDRFGGISDDAVRKATGKSWEQWLAILDAFDVKRNGHKPAAAFLHAEHQVGDWWSQMVVVGYEQARGLRDKHQRPDGYSVSGSRVIAAPLKRLYAAWKDPRTRARWLADPGFVVRRASPDKSLRITWVDDVTSVEVNFHAKDAGRSQVAVEHRKLASAAAARKMKAYWAKQLDRLRGLLEE